MKPNPNKTAKVVRRRLARLEMFEALVARIAETAGSASCQPQATAWHEALRKINADCEDAGYGMRGETLP